ncbi:MAG TPA: hypothetical protein ENK85_08900 [Saprospiraceae bacterium]|nr:hypothetical protein [Saprospiraceae bacterium]
MKHLIIVLNVCVVIFSNLFIGELPNEIRWSFCLENDFLRKLLVDSSFSYSHSKSQSVIFFPIRASPVSGNAYFFDL